MYAALLGNLRTFILLVEHGANPDEKSLAFENRSAREIAREKWPEIDGLLEQSMVF